MSKLGNAVDNMTKPGMGRLRGGSASLGYNPVKVYEEKQRPSWVDSLGKMVQAGADAYQAYDQRQRQLADERSNEIIRKLTPEQRREALNNGTLLYQDDPYAMEQLRFKTGRNSAFLVDNEISEGIKRGEFRTREEMEQRRHARLQEVAKSSAEEWGINEQDADYQRGFNADITERNINLYNTHDSFLSDQSQKGAVLNAKVELNGALSDPAVLGRPEAGDFFSKYIDNGLVTGSIPNDNQALAIINGTISDVIQRPGGAAFLKSIGDKRVKLNGVETTYRELLGDDMFNNYIVKAEDAAYKNDAKLFEKVQLGISSALNQADTSLGWEQLQALKAENDKMQPSEQMTQMRSALLQAEQQMMNRVNQESAAVAKETDTARKLDNKARFFDERYTQRINGEYVPLDYKDMPTNENTGEYTHSDAVNFANRKLAQIDSMDITPAQRDKLKLDYLRVDPENGPFRTAIGSMVDAATQEWQGAMINGELPQSTPALDKLREIRNVDPQLFGALYPDKADLFLTMDMLDSQAINPQKLIDAGNLARTRTKETQFEADQAYKTMKNNSLSPDIKYLPGNVDAMARKIYDAALYVTGNPDGAAQQVDKYLKETVTTFSQDDADGDTVGVVPNNMLQVNSDPKSYEQGRDIINAAKAQLIKEHPDMSGGQTMVVTRGNVIHITDLAGQHGISFTQEELRKVWADQQKKTDDAAREKALKDAQKRAPISQVTKARKVARERVINNRRKVPNKIYGSE